MNIYHYASNGEYLSTTEARPDPLSKDRFLIPSNATTIAPPVPPIGSVAKFVDDRWEIAPDHRGETWYQSDRQPVIINTIGDPSELGLFPVKPNGSLEDAKVHAIKCLDEETEDYRELIAGNVSPLRAAELADKARTADRLVNNEPISSAHILEAKRELVSLNLAATIEEADPIMIAPVWQAKAAAFIDARSRINVIYRKSLAAFQGAQTHEELSAAVAASRSEAAQALADFNAQYNQA